MDEKVARFLTRAIERFPADRFQTPVQFREALSRLPNI
jgi:hypothetical protein